MMKEKISLKAIIRKSRDYEIKKKRFAFILLKQLISEQKNLANIDIKYLFTNSLNGKKESAKIETPKKQNDQKSQTKSDLLSAETLKLDSSKIHKNVIVLHAKEKKYFIEAIWCLRKSIFDGLVNKSLTKTQTCIFVRKQVRERKRYQCRRGGGWVRLSKSNLTTIERSGKEKSRFLCNNNEKKTKCRASTNHTCAIHIPNASNLPHLHKSKDRYFVGRTFSDDREREKQQKTVKSILNKLTPNNFGRLCAQLSSLNFSMDLLDDLVTQIFQKALDEPTFSELYADLVHRLPKHARNALIGKCQKEFERNQHYFSSFDDDINQKSQQETQNDKKNTKIRSKALGNIHFIGNLYRYGLLARVTIENCIQTLLRETENPVPENVEVLCKLMSTVGQDLEEISPHDLRRHKYTERMNIYISKIEILRKNTKLNTRIRFMCQDVLDLRLNHWKTSRKEEGPKRTVEPQKDLSIETANQPTKSKQQMLKKNNYNHKYTDLQERKKSSLTCPLLKSNQDFSSSEAPGPRTRPSHPTIIRDKTSTSKIEKSKNTALGIGKTQKPFNDEKIIRLCSTITEEYINEPSFTELKKYLKELVSTKNLKQSHVFSCVVESMINQRKYLSVWEKFRDHLTQIFKHGLFGNRILFGLNNFEKLIFDIDSPIATIHIGELMGKISCAVKNLMIYF
eukprot:gnl/TRDRNA2_/TRDRNA2_177836_c0_seq2.p1 gnl/TRDRNA2_/TRDRNA2_177836_c0~~gnl/TRDRNA2_/TRDRNA2_177836_c0_seq2.p1  ORF type:complete len:680 (+),score=-31.03 gnl/TRDRNA2_/TRDRNA2_177836_c0_seq2:103-2142(+)